MKYAPSTGCFYPDEIGYTDVPSDAIDTTPEMFVEWCAAPGATMTIAGSDITINAPAPPSDTEIKAGLISYAEAKRASVAAGGITVNVGAKNSPLDCAVSTSAAGIADLTLLIVQASLTGSTTWYQASGSFLLTTAQIGAIQSAVGSFVASSYAALAEVTAEVNAGTITEAAQIDAANWPTNS